MISTNIVFPPKSVSNPGYNRFETFLTVEDFKKRFLVGVPLTDSNGNLLVDDETIKNYILIGVSYIEHALNITLTPTTYTEKRDYSVNNYYNYGFIDLYHKPIIKVNSVKVKYQANQTLIQYPLEWLRVYSEIGQIQVTPTSGALNYFNLDNSGYLPQLLGVASQYPQLFEIEYVAGFEQDKIPYFINQIVGMYGAIPLLISLGTSTLGVGISGASITLDGLSQSTNLFNNPRGLYGARIQSYQDLIGSMLELAKRYYGGGFNLMVT